MLILPGGDAWDAGGNGEAVDVARDFLDAGVPVAAICGATAGLARGGLLDARRHTSNVREYLEATGYGGAAYYRDEAVVADRDVITASAMAPLDFARAIFRAPRTLRARGPGGVVRALLHAAAGILRGADAGRVARGLARRRGLTRDRVASGGRRGAPAAR